MENEQVAIRVDGISVWITNKETGEKCNVALGRHVKSATMWVKGDKTVQGTPKYKTLRYAIK